jgi:hypothetical protein
MAICVFLLGSPALFALAAESGAAKETSNVTITVVMPEPEPKPADKPADEPAASIKVYPSEVTEIREGGEWLIVKSYELSPGESPEDIPRDSFARGGWNFTLTDIIRKETANAETREHTETVTLSTDTKELEKILPQLAPTMEYKAEDAFIGILALDISSIKVEIAGTRTSSYAMSVTREYPRLSASDTSFVPKTVTDKGQTYTLASVDWRAGSTETTDYSELPEYYTAEATYTATGPTTKITGYTTTALYTGTLAKLAPGKTVYTAYFLGAEIRTPLEISAETTESTAASAQPSGGPDSAKSGKFSAWLALIPLTAIFAGGARYFIKEKRENKQCENS